MPRYASCIWRPITNNIGGQMSGRRGLLMHQQVGYGSLAGFFQNPASKVSAHFWVGRDGTCEQYVDSRVTAWHATSLNGAWCGVEFEGYPTEPLTDAQIAGGGRIYAEGMRVDGWPARLTDDPNGSGFGFHRMGGVNKTACPSDLRLAARPAILAAAGGGSGSAPAAPAPPASSPGKPPATAGPPWPGRVLLLANPYMEGDDVGAWQERMRERGWAIGVDGLYGPQSVEVCRRFQAEKALQVDGMVGPVTWGAAWSAPVT
jgi:hypothetical protein